MKLRTSCLLFAVGAFLPLVGPSSAAVVVPFGFTATTFNAAGTISGLAISPGVNYGSDLYAGSSGIILKVDPTTGAMTTFATGLATGANSPDGLAFDPGTFGGGDLFVSENAGMVVHVSAAGAISTLSSGGTLFSSNDLVFAPTAGGYGSYLYVSNGNISTGFSISSVDAAGLNSLFSPGSNYPDVPLGLAFPGSGSPFGADLFVSLIDGTILRVSTDGSVAPFAVGLGQAMDIAFAPGGPFGDDLYVSDPIGQQIFRVAPDGGSTVFATGFGFSTTGFDADLAFSLDGSTLYVANNMQIVKITVDPLADAAEATAQTLLGTAYPNPSSGSIDLIVTGARTGVDALVVDVTGRLVRRLSRSSGDGSRIHWDGRGADGQLVGTGAYYLGVWDGATLLARSSVRIAR